MGSRSPATLGWVLALVVAALALAPGAAMANGGGCNGLSYDYYSHSCPNFERIVKLSLAPVFAADPSAPAAFLRLFFHDCQVQGCDASILLKSDERRGITTELESGKNFGIRYLDAIDDVKSAMEESCPGLVSCADIVVLAAREAVACAHGPDIPVPLGRRDSMSASKDDADSSLPSATIGVDGALDMFLSKGMSVEEMVAILGGHTLGVGHCVNIALRLYEDDGHSQENVDESFEAMLRMQCPAWAPWAVAAATVVPGDLTPEEFDNQYFRGVATGHGLFVVDTALPVDARTAGYVRRFTADEEGFFRAFSSAFVKLAGAGVLTEEAGEVRKRCDVVNYY